MTYWSFIGDFYFQHYQIIDFLVYFLVFSSIFKIGLANFFKKDQNSLILVSLALGFYLSLYLTWWEFQMSKRLFDYGIYFLVFFLFLVFIGISSLFKTPLQKSLYLVIAFIAFLLILSFLFPFQYSFHLQSVLLLFLIILAVFFLWSLERKTH